MAAAASIISWLHIMAAVTAVGGGIFALLMLRPVSMLTLEPSIMPKLMGGLGMRFRWVLWAAIAVFIVTGLWLAGVYKGITSGSDLMATSYGRTLLVKGILALILFASVFAITLPLKRLAWFRQRALHFQRLNIILASIIILLAAFLARRGGLF